MSEYITLPTELDEIQEDQPVDNGVYDLEIIKAQIKEAKNDKSYISVMIEIVGRDDAAPIFEMVWFPSKDSQYYRSELQAFKRFLQTFGVPVTAEGIDVAALPGLKASGITVERVDDEYRGTEVNKIKWPRIS